MPSSSAWVALSPASAAFAAVLRGARGLAAGLTPSDVVAAGLREARGLAGAFVATASALPDSGDPASTTALTSETGRAGGRPRGSRLAGYLGTKQGFELGRDVTPRLARGSSDRRRGRRGPLRPAAVAPILARRRGLSTTRR